MPMRFVAIDVETANPDIASICQIGLAAFEDGHLVETWSSLIDPEDEFDEWNVAIHGIGPQMVRGQPTFPQVVEQLRSMLGGQITVCHTHFDRSSFVRAFERYSLSPISTTWLDSARVARRTWSDVAWGGYGLEKLCRKIGFEFKHHDALEDAKAAGHVLLAAIRESGQDLDYWLRRVNLPIDPSTSSAGAAIRRDGNPEGDLFGEVLVFTGALRMPRSEAADLAARAGCQVAASVSKKTTILVVGDQDVRKLAGHEKSSKHRKAEELIREGCQIRILRESDFIELVQSVTA
ncbi:exonuclease domain-containing protein [Azohydromonas sediminis]|uniref:exonuclease domain-containing protein n=1 Tax=Azohydromonas sediminis TaxID=2259674 RepID=UPI001F1CB3C5|nr:exonuclease domain-containing protein [Azohydromonas sediminis]